MDRKYELALREIRSGDFVILKLLFIVIQKRIPIKYLYEEAEI